MSAPQPEQNLANHTRLPQPAYIAAGLVLFANLLWTVWIFFHYRSYATALAVATAAALIVVAVYARSNAQIVQDRLIRLEERLRLANILPADLKARIGELSLDQLIGLRFAGDAEVTDLTREVLAGNLRDRKAIKAKVRNWRADWLRV